MNPDNFTDREIDNAYSSHLAARDHLSKLIVYIQGEVGIYDKLVSKLKLVLEAEQNLTKEDIIEMLYYAKEMQQKELSNPSGGTQGSTW